MDIEEKQEQINKEYAEKGFSDEILQKQVKLNKIKNKKNIIDENNLLYKNFAQ